MLQKFKVMGTRWLTLLAGAVVGGFYGDVAGQAPPNDSYTNRIPVVGYAWTVTGSNNAATTEQNTSPIFENRTVAGVAVRRTVWWAWTAPSNGLVRVDTIGSSFDTVLGVYTGGATATNLVAGNNNISAQTTQSRLNFNPIAGTSYAFQVGGINAVGAQGTVRLNLKYFPEVTLTAPQNGTVLYGATAVLLQAAPYVYTGSVAQVEFYVATASTTNLVGTVTGAPYEWTATGLTPGQYQFYARIVDNQQDATVSARANVQIKPFGVEITSPADGQSYNAISNLTISASVVSTSSVTGILFYDGANLIGQANGTNGAVVWSNFSAGLHSLTAVAVNNQTAVHTSPAVMVFIKPFVYAVRAGSVWKYLDDGSNQGTAWTGASFNDASWAQGAAELGFGDTVDGRPEVTGINGGPATNRIITTYFRYRFVATNVANITNLICRLKRDDGAIIWLNGQRLYADNLTAASVTYTTLADIAAPDDGANFNETNCSPNLLIEGTNVLAVEMHQSSPTSSDLSFDFEMVAEYLTGVTTIALTNPTTNSYFLQPGLVQLTAVASNLASGVAKVEFYRDNVLLGQGIAGGAVYSLSFTNLANGANTFKAVATDNLGLTATSAVVTVTTYARQPHWTAFNDHAPGAGTGSRVSTYDMFGFNSGISGSLINVATGASLPVNLALRRTATGVPTGTSMAGTTPGTPAAQIFDGYVDLQGTPYPGIWLVASSGGMTTNLFTGVNTNLYYSFRGTAIFIDPTYTNRWTLVRLEGARAFAPAHTPGVLTRKEIPTLAVNEAVFNAGNNTAGDVVGWDDIKTDNGLFAVVCAQYTGPLPGNGTTAGAPYSYAITAIRLEESGPAAIVTVTVPTNNAVYDGPTNLTVAATVVSPVTVTNVTFHADGGQIGADATAPYSIVWTNATWATNHLTAVAYDNTGNWSTSAVVTVTVNAPPPNTNAPVVVLANVTPTPGSRVTNLTQIVVRFSENVTGVNASDLLLNGVAATALSGSGSNYTFTVTPPVPGTAQVIWAANHGIQDTGYPPLAFDAQAPGATWTYDVADTIPPGVIARSPASGSTLTNLAEITVTFSEPVTGVDATDFLINGLPAYGVTGGSNLYTFAFGHPGYGTVNITWTNTHGITDLTGNAFNHNAASNRWSYTLKGMPITLVAGNANWNWLPGTNEASLPTNAWRLAGFNASAWQLSPAPFFYDDNSPRHYAGNTLLSSMRSNYSTVYFRYELVVPNPELLTNVTLYYTVDDGLVAWLNNNEWTRTNVPAGELGYTALAPLGIGTASGYVPTPLTNYNALQAGTNVFAIQALNSSLAGSSDFLLNLYITADYLDPVALAPRIGQQNPTPGNVFALTNLSVTFTKPVTGVDAGDMLINGVPATGVAGSNMTYVFTFPQPPFGSVNITWATNHGIVDGNNVAFNATLAGATWSYRLVNPAAPVIAARVPVDGSLVIKLTNATVTFSKAVMGVDAADLLVNGVAATSVAGSGSNYVFAFSQPAYGPVAFSWSANHGIADAANGQNVFDGTAPEALWQATLVFQEPPVIAGVIPPPSRITNLTSVQVSFSEGVAGVNAADLLVNGVPADSLVVNNNSNYTFNFPQPAPGTIQFTWAAAHGIADLGLPPLPFDETGAGATWNYLVVDGLPPTLIVMAPASGSETASLTSVAVTFSEAVTNVEATDLLVNGIPATSLSVFNASTYIFTAPTVPYGPVQVTWAANHGITDLAANPFSGAGWNFIYYNPNSPVMVDHLPPEGVNTNALTNIMVRFDKAVTGVEAADLLVNDVPATNVVFQGGAYLFGVAQPAYGPVRVSWSTNHGIADAAQPANLFQSFRVGATWQFNLVYQAPPVITAVSPARGATVGQIIQLSVTFSEPVVNVNAFDLIVNGLVATNMTGSGSNYVFYFSAPPVGTMTVVWADDHGIEDLGNPPMPFDHTAPGASWTYTVAESTPPTVASQNPPAGVVVSNLYQVQVTFSEAVNNVDAADLLVNNVPAYGVTGAGSTWIFYVNQPAFGTVTVSWAANHGITDLAGNPFNATGAGATWTYTMQLPHLFLVATNSGGWTYYKGLTEASSPTDDWRQRTYDDSTWSTGTTFFYYGDPLSGTLLNDMQGNYSTVYIRKRFVIDDPAAVTNLVLRAASDDGFVAFINGTEVRRYNAGSVGAPDPYNFLATATAPEPNNAGPGYISYNLISPAPSTYLVAGTNVLTIHAFNQSLAGSSDFAINAELSADLLGNPTNEPPRILGFTPLAGEVYVLTNLTVTFTKPVINVNASDLLVNGVPATSVSGSNNLYLFVFNQPAYGAVSVTWASNHGITDLSAPPKAFDATALSARVSYILLNPNAPIIGSRSPDGSVPVGSLTNITVNFSRTVTGVDATDLLINGISATSVTGAGMTYVFSFPQPAFGTVQVTWAVNHGIVDSETNTFNATRPGAAWQIQLADLTPPRVAAVQPAPGSNVTNLTQVRVAFSEAVNGVNAADLLVNGVPAQTVVLSGSNYVFTFTPVNASVIQFTWSAAHGITDQATVPNLFDSGAPGSQWEYHTIDTLPPTIASIYPTPGAELTKLQEVIITFSEPVQGVEGRWLLVNGLAANSVAGAGAGPYYFNFATPATGAVQMAWATNHTIRDLAVPANQFIDPPWQYTLNPSADYSGKVVISEIMYHPITHRTNDEWIEIRNLTAQPVNLTGWRFSRGVTFNFPARSLPAGGYLVIAADTNAFQARYPGVANVVGNWVGQLKNSDEDIEVETVEGQRVALVPYATEGDWAVRRRGSVTYSNGSRGWEWYTPADGLGNSVELMNPFMDIQYGQNWRASAFAGGTPGTANSVATSDLPPMVLEVQHYPVIPRSTDPVRITARVLDEQTNGVTVTLYWRDATSTTPGGFNALEMFDDGTQGDLAASDRIFTAVVPAQANLTIVEFYVQASDLGGNTRTWPGPAYELDNSSLGQVANALYQVDNNTTTYEQPLYRMILTGAERQEFNNIWASDSAGNRIDAEMNLTLISLDRNGTAIRYLCGARNRGNSSRTGNPGGLHNFRVSIPCDNRWKGVRGFNFNCKYPHSQYVGATLFRKAGLPVEDANIVRFRLNGVDQVPIIGSSWTGTGNTESFPYYVQLEELNSDWTDEHYPFNSGGNIYRCQRTANLLYLGNNWLSYTTGGYNYSKVSNKPENDWSDLFNLTYVINNTPDSNYTAGISQVIHVDQWMRYYAVMNLIGFGETSLGSDGDPDDFSLYSGLDDPRFLVFPHDHDTDFGEGDGSRQQPTISIFRAADDAGALAFNRKFLRWPDFVPMYYAALYQYATTIFTTNEISATYDQLLGPLASSATVNRMKDWSRRRVASVLSQINLNLTVTNLAAFTVSNGWYVTTSPNLTLNGLGNVIHTRQVRVRGVAAAWTPSNGQWSDTVTLTPGYNIVTVETLNSNGVVFASTNLYFFYDRGTSTSVSGAIATDTIWLAANGPYNVTASITINNGATLTIQPGTTVYLGAGVNLTVANGGRLLAEGTASAPIRFSIPPGSANNWGGITVNGGAGSPETRIAYTHFERNGSTAIHSTSGTVFLDHLTFGNTAAQFVSLDGSSFVVQDCVFPTTTGSFEGVHGTGGIKAGGRGLFLRNFFGAANGYNDVVDFTGGNRNLGQPIVQFINNVFIGSGDDLLDLDGTDAWIERNIFLHTHKNGSPDSSSAISGGLTGSDRSDITIIGNIIYDCDQAANAKEGNFYTMINNTIVRITRQGGTDTSSSVALLADVGTAEGAGMYLEGNIIYDAEKLVAGQTASLVTYTNNIIYALAGAPWTGPGGNNVNADPLFKHLPTLAETANFTNWAQAQVLWDWFSLSSGSPAQGSGPNGANKGGVLPLGVTIAGVPDGVSTRNSVTLRVGVNRTGSGIPTGGFPNGSGFTHYQWRLDDGAWSAETSINTPIVLNNLPNGPHYVEAIGKNDAGFYQNDPVYGADAVITRSATWTVKTGVLPLQINEILASNRRAFSHFDTTPDVLELYNTSPDPIDLTGVRLTDDPTLPDKFEFPAGATLAGGAYLVLLANDYDGTPGYHLEFNLRREGQTIYLYDALSRGGALLDSVAFGPQITDLSIGRVPGGQWALTKPTLGAANVAQELGTPDSLKINEWLAAGQFYSLTDFVELFNPQSLPVSLTGLYLTDNPEGWPTRHPIAPLSFIGPHNYTVFYASGQADQGPDQLEFRLNYEHGVIGLIDANVRALDIVFYDNLRPDYSQGRSPNGAPNIYIFSEPTPGAGNPYIGGGTNIVTTNITLVDFAGTWKYNADNVDLGTTWRSSSYNDSTWLSGQGTFGKSVSAQYPVPVATTLPELGQPTVYFRTTFVYTGSTNGFSLVTSHYIDDGAVYYLNGAEIYRYNMLSAYPTAIVFTDGCINNNGNGPLVGPITLPCTNIIAGTNVLAVEVHQSSASSVDMAMAINLTLTKTTTNIQGGTVVLNEVFAKGEYYTNVSGRVSDWVELYNPGDQAVNLSGMGLTDNSTDPLRWIFPSGVQLGPKAYLVINCDSGVPASTNAAGLLNTGFGLKADSGAVSIYDSNLTWIASINYGIQIADYSIGRSPDGLGNWLLTTPTPGLPNAPVTLGNTQLLKVNEWMPNDKNGADDWFEIFNPGALPVALGGLFVTDDLANPIKSEIPPLSFIGVGTNAFTKIVADNNPAAGADHARFKLDALKEAIGLYSATGTLIDSISWDYVISQPGVSEGRFPDGSTNFVFFPETASPGESNYRLLTNVVISEVLTHSDPPFEDAIELQNLDDVAVNIGGWYLSDAKSALGKYRIPLNTMVPPHGFVVFYEYQFNDNPANNRLAFSLSSAKGDQVYLSTADTNGVMTGYRTSVKFGPALNSVTFGRYLTSDAREEFVSLSRRTLGVDEPNTVEEFRTGAGASNAYPLVGPVAIRQIMYHPPDLGTNDNVRHEFIEIYNSSTVAAPLYDPSYPTNTWRLRDAVDYEFPSGLSLPAGGSVLVVSFNPAIETTLLDEFRTLYHLSTNISILGPYRGKLDNGSENIELYQPDAPELPPSPDAGLVPYVLVERVKYHDAAPWPVEADGTGYSLQRVATAQFGNDPLNWIAAPVSFLQTNTQALNTPPTLDAIPNQLAALGHLLIVTNHAVDADVPAQTLKFELGLPAPAGAAINADTGYFTWTPAVVGTQAVTIIVRDDGIPAMSATQTLVVVVQDRRVNLAPSGNNFQLSWGTQVGVTYRVQYKNDLNDPAWTTLPGGDIAGTGNPVTVTDPGFITQRHRYYQILTVP